MIKVYGLKMVNYKIDEAFILCAGLGTRMRPLTLTTPKPLVPVLGKPMLEHNIDLLIGMGIRKIIINAFYLKEQIEEYIAIIAEKNPSTEFKLVVEPELLGSGGGVKNILQFIDNDYFWTINGDMIRLDEKGNEFENLATNLDDNTDCLMLATAQNKAFGYNGSGDLTIEGVRPIKGGELVFSGVQIFNKAAFTKIDKNIFLLPEIYFANDLNIKVVLGINTWLHIGTEKDLISVENQYSNLFYR